MRLYECSIMGIRASYPDGKWEPLWTRCVLRPLSFPAAWLFLKTGLSANQISLLSVYLALFGAVMLAAGGHIIAVGGAVLFNICSLLDCVDGHVARVRNEASVYGAWVDGFAGYAAYSLVLLAGGAAAETAIQTALPFFQELDYVLLGSLAAIANLFMRLAYQHFRCIRGHDAVEKIKWYKKTGANFGITGFLMPAVLVGVLTGGLPWVVLFYAVFYTGSCLIVATTLYRLVKDLQRELMHDRMGAAEK